MGPSGAGITVAAGSREGRYDGDDSSDEQGGRDNARHMGRERVPICLVDDPEHDEECGPDDNLEQPITSQEVDEPHHDVIARAPFRLCRCRLPEMASP